MLSFPNDHPTAFVCVIVGVVVLWGVFMACRLTRLERRYDRENR